jgi:hypothetical protein
MANDLLVRILGDTKGLERSFAQANRATGQFGRDVQTVGTKADKATRSLKGFATGAAAGFGGAVITSEVLGQMRAAIDVASNLQEQMSKTAVVFGDSADAIEDWSKTTASSIGIARDEALAAASTFGAMFDQAGRSTADAARLSKAVVQLAADLASFNNTTVDDALNALRSGLSGEIEPLRRFQVFLTEAAVSAEAMAASGKKSAKELTQGEKIMARWNIILRQTNKQQGDFERTSEGLANQQRILSARTRDLQANMGQLLLPVMTRLVENLNDATSGALLLADGLNALAKLRIPEIEIPFVVTIGGSRVGDLAGDVAGKLKFTPLNPFFAHAIALRIKEAFSDGQDEVDDAVDQGVKDYAAAVNAIPERFAKAVQPRGFRGPSPAATGIKDAIDVFINAARKQVNDTVREGKRRIAADAAKQRQDTFFQDLIAGLELGVDRAALNRTLRDDLAARQALKVGLERQIAAGVDVINAQRQLVQVEREILDTGRQITENRRAANAAARQRQQFRALGLSATGDEIIPGIKNLQARIDGALRRIQSGELDVSSKLVDRLKLARNLIRKEGKNLTAETRSVINDLIKTVTQGQKELSQGPRTATTSLNANKLLAGLGLGPDMERELRARLSSFNSAGLALAGGGTRPTGRFVVPPTIVESHVRVELDGEPVARSVTRSQQKQRRRNPKQKRGPNSGV